MDLPRIYQEYMNDVDECMQMGGATFQREYATAKDAGRSDEKAKRIAMKRSKKAWNLKMDAVRVRW